MLGLFRKKKVVKKLKAESLPAPLEHDEQKAFVAWCRFQSVFYPELNMLFAIPNGELRDKKTAVKLKKEGLSAGVPDLFLAVARGEYHGLFIEMKRVKGGSVSEAQKKWITELRLQNYYCQVCKGCDEAIKTVKDYLGISQRL